MAITQSSLTFGNESEYLSVDGAIYNSIAIINSTKFLVAYQDDSNSKHGTVKIGNVSGTNITFGNAYQYLPVNGTLDNAVSIAVLDESTFVVAYQDETNSGHGTAKVGSISGTTITFGPETEFVSTARAAHITMSTVDSSHVVISYADWSDNKKGKVIIGTIAGNSISFGSPSIFYSLNEATVTSISSFDSSKFVVCYRKGNAVDLQGAARIGTIAGTSITLGTETEFSTLVGSQAFSIWVDTLDTSSFVVSYRDANNSGYGTIKVGSVSGTTATFGSGFVYLPSGTLNGSRVVSIDASNFVVVYTDGGDSNHGTAKIGTINANNVLFGAESEFLSENGADYVGLGILDTNKLVVSYTDLFNSNHGTTKITTAILTPTVSGVPLRIIHKLTKTHDYDPQLVSIFQSTPSLVNIEVWDVINAQNTKISLSTSGCYKIGGTNAWGWSTEYLPFTEDRNKYHYYFKMTSDLNDTQYGEFLIFVPERGRWSYPD